MRSLRFVLSVSAVVAVCGASFVVGYRTGYLDSLREYSFQTAMLPALRPSPTVPEVDQWQVGMSLPSR